MDSFVVKVKYGDTLRRFNAPIKEDGLLYLDMNGLREQICGLFNFPIDADLNLTYIDEDGDVVTLVDDNDLCDVMRQELKFLRITVQLNNDNKSARSHSKFSSSSTPLRSPRVQNPLPTGFEHLLTAVPEPLREKLSKLSLDVTAKASSLNPVSGELVECVSKMWQPFLHYPIRNPAESNAEIISDNSMPVPGQANQSELKAGLSDFLPKTPGMDLKEENVTRGGVAPATHAPVDLNAVPSRDTDPPRFVPVNIGSSSPISYPIIDLPENPAPTEEVPCIDVPASADVGTNLNENVETTLLKELKEMGFKQIDLNKEILRKNEYDLEQSVDDLCGVAEWAPILEELQEMGFCDKEMIEKLLQKNNGSIKQVVMDLLSGEKA